MRRLDPETRRENARARSHRWYLANKDHQNGKARAWKAANREKVNASARANRDVQKSKDRHLRAKYGLTLQQYEELYAAQEGRCLICHEEHPVLHVDHDHGSSVVRGLLCGPCNRGIGLFDEDPSRLTAAIQYLEGRRGR